MAEENDYSALTLEELRAEEKKLKRSEWLSALGVGILAGVMIFGIVKNGFGFLYIVIPVLMIGGLVKSSQVQKAKLKEIQAEIGARETA
ncbi:MAG: hypothetical protein AAFZ63_17095 [Bacteroidota bacterium]